MLSIKVDLRPAQRALGDIGRQVPFASALALTQLAAGVQTAEQDEEAKVFDKATAFTKNAFAKVPAKRNNLVATVFIKDKTSQAGGQNAYLAPYVVGGDRSLGGKKGMIVPRETTTNQYGNLTKGQLARLKAKPGVFIGKVTFRTGKRAGQPISGVWQRSTIPRGKRRDGSYGTKGDSQGKVGGVRTTLKLLIEFEDTTPVTKHLDFYGRAEAYVNRNAQAVFESALAQAIAMPGRK